MAVIIPETSPVPEDLCESTLSALWPKLVALTTVTIPDAFGFNEGYYSGGVPPEADQGKPWYRRNADNSPDGWYAFFSGVWCRPHELQQGTTNILQLYDGDSVTDLPTYDGGNAGIVTAISGPMWELVSAWVDRFPRGAGATAVNVNATIVGSAATFDARGVNFIRRTTRIYRTYPV